MLDISIWLIPHKEQENELQTIINSLALTYQAFSFLPHITAYYLGNKMRVDKVITDIQEATKDIKPFTLTLDKISYSEQFTKTLFAEYLISPEFLSLYTKLKEKFYSFYPYELNPHLSLIYKNNMEEKDKLKVIKRLKIPQQLTVDRVMVITKEGSTITKEKDVLNWHVVFELRLK